MISAANKTIVDPSQVANGLRTISMRLRAVDDETGETLPKLRQELIDLTKGTGKSVDIWDTQNNSFKSTADIIVELADVWGQLSDINKAQILEDVAGSTILPECIVMCI